jgi:hypothetical protein
VDEDWEENGCGMSVEVGVDIEARNLLPWTDPLENLNTSGHLLKHQWLFRHSVSESIAYLRSFFLELFAKG